MTCVLYSQHARTRGDQRVGDHRAGTRGFKIRLDLTVAKSSVSMAIPTEAGDTPTASAISLTLVSPLRAPLSNASAMSAASSSMAAAGRMGSNLLQSRLLMVAPAQTTSPLGSPVTVADMTESG